MKTTIKDIAAMAGVSPSTVSRALNNQAGMEENTRERILNIADRLGYRPSAFARGLVLQRTKTVMVLVPDLANYFFAEITQELSAVCRERGYKVLLGSTSNQPDLEREYLASIREGAVDGAIVIPQLGDGLEDAYLGLMRSDFPFVLIDRTFDRFKTSSVVVDNRIGGRIAVDHLVSKGHERVAFIGGDIDNVHSARDRHRGYTEGLKRNGLSLRKEYVFVGCPSPDRGGVDAIEKLLNMAEPPTAVFADSDLTAFACVGAAHRHGRKVPDDLAVMGFDNINISAHFDVPLTTIGQPKREIAERAVDMAIHMIGCRRKDAPFGVTEEVVKPQLIERASA